MRQLLLLPVLFCLNAGAQQQQSFYPSGSLQYSYELKNGKLNGSFTSYYENGIMKVKGNFESGKKANNWQAWDEEGVLRIKRNFNKDAVDVVSEWNKNGCQLDAAYLDKKEKDMNSNVYEVKYENLIFGYRYWNLLLPSAANSDLYAKEFTDYLREEILAGRIVPYADDRCVTAMKPDDVSPWLKGSPTAFLTKENHDFTTFAQRTIPRIICFGITYEHYGATKTAWLYFNDLRTSVQNSAVASAVIKGLDERNYDITIDMTTYKPVHRDKPRKVTGNEGIFILMAEVDMEATAWIYLQEKDMAVVNNK